MPVRMPSAPSSTDTLSHSCRASGTSSAGGWGIAGTGLGSRRFSARLPGLPVTSLRWVGLGRRPSRIAARLLAALGGNLGEARSSSHVRGDKPRELLPAPDRDIDIGRIELDGVAAPPDHPAATVVVPDPQKGS